MSALIIAVISLALIAAIALATTHFMGNSHEESRADAEVSQSLNEISQIKGAMAAHYAENGTYPESLDALVPKYLSAKPKGWGEEVPSLEAFEVTKLVHGSDETKARSCLSINKKLGMDGDAPPNCASIPSDFTGCCVIPDEVTP